MKTSSQWLTGFVSSLALLCLMTPNAWTAPQGTAFTFQGRLMEEGHPAQGQYDIVLTLYDSATDGLPVAGPVTNRPVEVVGGLFSVTIDFGGDVFNGEARWLEIGVRTNDATEDYALILPRQSVASTPYAMQALRVSAVSADRITGTLPDARLSTNVALLDGSPSFSGAVTAPAFIGQGALSWQEVTDLAQQTAPNTAYLANSSNEVALTLPVAPMIGDVVRVSGLGAGGWRVVPNEGQSILLENLIDTALGVWTARDSNRYWYAVASSADGVKLVAVAGYDAVLDRIYTSTDSGLTWIPRETELGQWVAVASSADGTKLVAADWANPIYTSTDSGVTWAPRGYSAEWTFATSSADGSKLAVTSFSDPIFTSTDSGTNWVLRESRDWWAVASSSDGNKLVGVVNGGQIYTSTDGGTNWVARETNRPWRAVASSADGTRLLAGAHGGRLYTSADSGGSWVPRESDRLWRAVASSADGSILYAAVLNGKIYKSVDAGMTWTAGARDHPWVALACSAGGSKAVAATYGGQLYTLASEATANPIGGEQGSDLELLYRGNGQFQVVNSTGTFEIESTVLTTGLDTKVNRTGDTMTGILTGLEGFAGRGSLLTDLEGSNLMDGTVTGSKLVAGTVTSNALAAGSVTSQVLAEGAVTTSRIQDGTVSSADLENGAVSSAKLSNDAASLAKVSGGIVGIYSGRIGLGTASPIAKLDVRDGTGVDGQGGAIQVGGPVPNADSKLIYFGDASAVYLGETGMDDRMELRADEFHFKDGNVGVGTTSPASKLHVVGDVTVTGASRGNIASSTQSDGAPFPRPAYNSGWRTIDTGQTLVLTHNIGGDADNYFVEMQTKGASGINIAGHGSDHSGLSNYGIYWFGLNTVSIQVIRHSANLSSTSVRIRIWVIR